MSWRWIGICGMLATLVAGAETVPVTTNAPAAATATNAPVNEAKSLPPAKVAQQRFEDGVDLLQNGSYTAAIIAFRDVLSLTNFPEAHGNLGVALLQLGRQSGSRQVQFERFQGAAEEFAKAAALAPKDRMIYLLWSDALVQIGDLPLASTMRSGCYQGAVAKCRQALEVAPDSWEAQSRWATILATKLVPFATSDAVRLNLYKESFAKFASAAEAGGFSSEQGMTYASWADALVRASRVTADRAEKEALLKEALDKFDHATRAAPKLAGIWAAWGNACLEYGKLTRTRSQFRDGVDRLTSSLSFEPNNPAALYDLARGHALMENTVMALQSLQHCFENDPSRAFSNAAATDPDFKALRTDSRYEELTGGTKSVGLPAFNPPLPDGSR